MSTAIVYSSKTGTALRCAQLLSQQLPDAAVIEARQAVDLSRYDTIVLGGSIRAGRIGKGIRKFAQKNCEALLAKRVAIFVCCASAEGADGYIRANFPEPLVAHAAQTACFGGAYDLAKCKGFDRFVVKMAINMTKKANEPMPSIHEAAIAAFASALKNEAAGA